jgi:hypothetical protein
MLGLLRTFQGSKKRMKGYNAVELVIFYYYKYSNSIQAWVSEGGKVWRAKGKGECEGRV